MRRTPIRHTVRRHKRMGKWVDSFERGHGVRTQRKSRVVRSTQETLYKSGDILVHPYGEEIFSPKEHLEGGSHISDLHMDIVSDGEMHEWPVFELSYVTRDDRMIFWAGGMPHHVGEEIAGYDPDDYANTKRITRLSLDEDGSIRMYTYGVGPRVVKGWDAYPNVTASSLRKMISRGLIRSTDKINIVFDKFGRSADWHKYPAQEAIAILKDAQRMNR